MNIQILSASERIILAQALWESVHMSVNELAVVPDHLALLERRLAELTSDQNPGEPWETVRQRITQV